MFHYTKKKKHHSEFSAVMLGNMDKFNATVHSHSNPRSTDSTNLAKIIEFALSKKCKSLVKFIYLQISGWYNMISGLNLLENVDLEGLIYNRNLLTDTSMFSQ